jgi:ABC-2 type transport system permease protein
MIHPAVKALVRRDLRRYFSDPTGYVFITLFIFLSGAAAFWRPRFFLNNLATLDQLNEVFPYLLLFFVPALTMGVWSDERKQGTDELLLTLPATDLDIVTGKYVAVVAIYTVSLLLSLSHVAVLAWLGRPDPGLIAANYLGYWLTGLSLIAVGMLASVATENATIAFILAVALCSIPVAIDTALGAFGDTLGQHAVLLGVSRHFDDFAGGVVSLGAVQYFLGLAALCLYLNVLLLGRPRWRRTTDRVPLAFHHTVRSVAIATALATIMVMLARADLRIDLTAERLHSIGAETRRLIATLPLDRPVRIEAFVSPDVPAEYVQARDNLVGTLREIQALAGRRIDVLLQDTAPYSDTGRTARERFGILPRMVADPSTARTDNADVFLGVAFTSGPEEQVLPFFEHGLSAEYEIARAIRTVTRTRRKRIGIVDTDAKVFGGAEFETGRTRLPWAIGQELRQQYEVVQLTPWDPIHESVDALLVVLPSTLLQREMDNVFDAVRSGLPTLMIVDPLPAVEVGLAPAAPMAARFSPYASSARALVRKNTGDIQQAMATIGIKWPPARIAWDSYRPHPGMGQLPRELVFVGTGNGNAHAFSAADPATSGLQELVMMYPGYLEPADTPGFDFEPIVRTGRLSGTVSYFELVQPTPSGFVLNVNALHQPDGHELTLAAHIRSTSASVRPVDVIAVADLDFISDQFFEMRANAPSGVAIDNITFFLNCLDVLAGDKAFIALRQRRVRYRTLERVEARTRAFLERRSQEEQQAAAEAEGALAAARNGLTLMVDAVEHRSDLDAQAKQIVARTLEETENRKLAVLRTKIEQAKEAKVQASRETMESGIRRIQSTIRLTAVLAPPLPVVGLGLLVFVRRRQHARLGAVAMKRLRE